MVLSDLNFKLLEENGEEVTSHDINHNRTVSYLKQSTKRRDSIRESALKYAASFNIFTQRLAASSSFLSSSPFSALSPGNDSVFFSDTYYDSAHLTNGLCRDYVACRLKRSGVGYKLLANHHPPAEDQLLSSRILRAGHTFESLHPSLFRNLSRKINYFFDSEQTIRRLYYRLGIHILGIDRRSYTRARVLSLFCLAGAVAVDCASQGHPELVDEVVKIASDFMKQNILEWVVDRGGWIAMASHFTRVRQEKQQEFWVITYLKSFDVSISAFGFVGLALLGLFGAHFLV